MKTTLNEAARLLQVHPRTILRAITRKPNPYWVPGHNDEIKVSDVARGFHVRQTPMEGVFVMEQPLLTPDEAAEMLGVAPRTFRSRSYPALIRKVQIVRYVKDAVLEHHYLNHMPADIAEIL